MKGLKLLAATMLVCGIGSAPASGAPVFSDLNTVTVDNLVNSLLSGGSGITINSASYTGANEASGLFTNGNSSNIGINQGIVLSSGFLSTMGSNFSVDTGAPGNSILEDYNGNMGTHNASTLTIEFTQQAIRSLSPMSLPLANILIT